MKILKAKHLKPITPGDKLLDYLVGTSEIYSITYEKAIDGLKKPQIEKENYD